MTIRTSWLNALAVRRTIIPDRVYWPIFALLLISAVALRAFWICVLQIPYVYPDSHSYVVPIVTHWLLPFSPARTGGTSMFVSAALAIFRDPIGILILNGIISIASAALLAVAIKTVLKQNVLSLVTLFMAAFTAKNITFEYYLLSEPYARVLYIVYAALMLWYLQSPRRIWIVALIGLSIVLNILVKPSALVLVVATVIAFIAVGWVSTGERRQLALAAAVFTIAIAAPLLGYMLAFQARFGTFGLSQFDGYNLYSHVGHLTLLDGGKHPALKERLKPLLETYVEKYAAKGDYRPNWLVYGSSAEDLSRDFGQNSPARVVGEYVTERYPSRNVRWINEVYGDLAIEAMLAHPVAYLRYAAESALRLWRSGFDFTYYAITPSADTLQTHRDDRAIQRKWYYQMYGETPPPCGSGPAVPAGASGPSAALFHGAIASCAALPYEEPSVQEAVRRVDRIYRSLTNPVRNNFRTLAHIGAVSAVVAPLMMLLLRERRARKLYAFALLLMLVLVGYTILHGLANVSEPQRMVANVQDFAVIASCTFVFCAVISAQRLLLYAIMLKRRRLRAATSLGKPDVRNLQN